MTGYPNFPAISALVRQVTAYWPDHLPFLEKSMEGRGRDTMRVSEELSRCILALAEADDCGLDRLCEDYRFLCEEIVLPEEIHFRRNGTYRLSSFHDANAECYSNAPFMARYMNGLLLSDVLWANHANAFTSFVVDYLPRLSNGARHLEIGPGHGLFLYFAALHPGMGSVDGWDISPTSIATTRHALALLDAPLQPRLSLQDMFEAKPVSSEDLFDSVTMSEILEHLEQPVAALTAAAAALRPGGLIFVNVPANSPAPDHLFLFEGLEHARDVVQRAGFKVLDAKAFPMTGVTLEMADKHKLAVSCIVIGEKSHSMA